MALVGLWLLSLGVADLVRSDPACARWRTWLGLATSTATVLGILASGHVGGMAGAYVVLLVALTAAWLFASSWVARTSPEKPLEPRPTWPALLSLGAGGGAVLLLSPGSPTLSGPVASWFRDLPFEAAGGSSVDRAAAVLGAATFLLVTANVVVRLVLTAAGSSAARGEQQLKGGRVLGPMERLFIFGLGLAGQLTAAAVIVAAKGLLRFPELQAHDCDGGASAARRIDELTEYFLIGSMTSWLLALLCVAIV